MIHHISANGCGNHQSNKNIQMCPCYIQIAKTKHPCHEGHYQTAGSIGQTYQKKK